MINQILSVSKDSTKKFSRLFALIFLMFMFLKQGYTQTTYVWDCSSASTATSGSNVNLTLGNWGQGNNNGTTTLISTTSASTGYTGASGTSNFGASARTGVLSTGSSGSAYFEITLTPSSNYIVSLTAISFGSRSTSTGPQAYTLRRSTDSYASDVTTGTLSNTSTWELKSNTGLSSSSGSGTAITYRIYGYNGTGTASVNTANWRVDDIKLTVNVISNLPTITGNTTTTAFTTTYGTASAAQSFAVSGTTLTADLIATAPTGFEVSKDGTTYGATAAFTQTSGSASGTLRIRLKADAAVTGSYNSQNIVLSSTGATSVNITTASSGSSVTAKGLTIVGLSAANKNYDGNTSVSVSGTAAYSGLVNSESFTPSDVVTWAFADANVGSNKTLTRTGTYSAPNTNYTIIQPSLTASIVAIVPTAPSITSITAGNTLLSVAFSAPASNGGATISNYEYSVNGGTSFTAVSPAQTSSPLTITGLTNDVTYDVQIRAVNSAGSGAASSTVSGTPTAPSAPEVYAIGTITAMSSVYGSVSTASSFAVSGTTLTNDVTVTPPAGFELSLNGTTYSSSITLTQSGGSVSSTTVYIRLLSSNAAGNYSGNVTISSTGATDVTIAIPNSVVNTKSLTITGLTAQNKVYDRTTSATVTGTPEYSGLVNGETYSVSGNPTWVFTSNLVGNNIPLTLNGTSYSAPSSNYTVTQPSLSANITPLYLTVANAIGVSKTYDSSTVATYTGTLNGVISPDAVNLNIAASFASANAGTSVAITSNSTISGTNASNYLLTQPTGLSANINKANQTITFGTLPSKASGDASFALNGSASSKLSVTYSSSNPSVATVLGNTVTIVGAGTTVITASQSGDNNYNTATDVSRNLVITYPIIAGWDFTGVGGTTNTTVAATTFNSNLVSTSGGSNISRGAGAAWSIASNSFRTTGFQNNGISTSNTDYFQTTLQAQAGYLLSLNAINANLNGTTSFFATPGVTSQYAYSLDGSTFNLIGSPVTQTSLSLSVDVSGIAVLQNVPHGTTVYIRYYASGQTTTGGWGFASASTAGTNGLAFTGALTAAIPTINTSGSISSLTTTYGTPSSTTSFTLNGTDLSTKVTITPPAGFEVSTKSNFSDSVGNNSSPLLVGAAGNLASRTIYVRLRANASVAASPYSGNIVCSTTGAASVNVATASSSVSTKALTISGITGANKVYDGNSSASYTGTASYSGLANSESFSVVGTATAVFADSLAGTSKSISVTGFEAPSSNYTITQPTLIANITAKALSLNGLTAENKVYNGNTTASVIGTATLNGVLGIDIGNVTLNGTASATFSDANVGTGKSVTVSGYSISGSASSNYSLGNTILSADITKADQSINFLLSSPVVYPVVSSITLSATSTSGLSVSYISSNTAVATVSGNVLTILSDGTTSITASQIGDGNYNAASSVSQTLEVQASTLQNQTITFNTLSNKTYGDADFAPGATSTSGLTVSYSSSNTSVATIVSGNIHIVGAGTTTITATQDGNNDYNPAPSLDRTLVVNPKSLTVTAATAQNKAYDGTTTANINNVILNGVVGTDNVSATGGGVFADKNAGSAISVTASLTLTGAQAGNYTLAGQPTGLSADINPKAVNIIGLSFSNKPYDANNFASVNGIASLSGIVSADINDVYLFEDFASFTFSTSAVGNNIPIIISDYFLDGIAAGNYSLVIPTNLTANITPLSLYITGLSANNKTYDGLTTTTFSGTPILNGILSGEESEVQLSGTTAVANFSSANVGNGITVNVSGYTLTGSLAGNYTVTQPNGLTANITKAALTVSGITANNKVYDRTKTATLSGTAILSGLASTDAATVILGGTPSALFNDSIVGATKPVSVTGYTISGTAASNYDFTQPTGLTADITQASQTITFNAIPVKSTGDANFKLLATASSFLPVTYTSSNPLVATIGGINGDTIIIVGAGITTITASQVGNINYTAATNVQQTLTVLAAIAKWSFDAITSTNTGTTVSLGSGSTAADQGVQTSGSSFAAVHSSASTVWSNPAGNGSTKSISSNNWSAGDYYQFVVNTNGYYNLSVLFDQTGSNTGPRNFKLQYSKNGSTYTDFTSFTIPYNTTATPTSAYSWSTSSINNASRMNFDLSSIITLNGVSTAYFRIVNTDNVAINGGTVAVAGASRIDNFTLTGRACEGLTTFNVTGGGSYCNATTGFSVGLSGSIAGTTYQLVRNGSINVGSAISGTGAALDFGNQITPGAYTVVATDTTTKCTTTMTGTASIVEKVSTVSSQSQSACDSYKWNGVTYTTNGTYSWSGTNAAGCDSTATLNLTITTSTSNASSASTCDSYTWSVTGLTYTTSGTYSKVSGCHTEILNLTITASTSNTTIESVCNSYLWSVTGLTYTTSGSYSKVTGCHTEFLNLTINQPTSSIEEVSSPGSYTWPVTGLSYPSSGTYTKTGLTNAAGCDSVVTLHLTITCAPTSSTETISACGSYTWHGSTYTLSTNTPTWITTNAAGCDSVVTLNLTINNGTYNNYSEVACNSYVWNGATYTASGSYTYNYNDVNGCASYDVLALTINVSKTSTSNETICAANLPYSWNGNNYTSSGTYSFSTTSAANCDSVATLVLTVATATSSVTNYSACGSTLPYYWNGVAYNTAGTYTASSTNAVGCDSTEVLNLTVTGVTPGAPTTVTQTLISNDCGQRIYRYAVTAVSGAAGYEWTLPTSIGGIASGATVDSGDITTSRVIRVMYSSNAAAGTDSIKVRAYSGCGSSVNKAFKLSNTLWAPLAAPAITATNLVTNVCGQRAVRYSVPVAATTAGAIGYEWSFVGDVLGANAVIDSGATDSRVIVVLYSSNAGAVVNDSVKFRHNYNDGCSYGAFAKSKIGLVALTAPLAPTITATTVVINVCGGRKVRYSVPATPSATATAGAATGYDWSFVGTGLSASATIDSGATDSRVIVVLYSSNAAATAGDSVRCRYTSACGFGAYGKTKNALVALTVPASPSAITATTVVSNVCGGRKIRYSVPVTPSASATAGAATGYEWSLVGTGLSASATIDSGSSSSRVIVVLYSSNSAAASSDSVKCRYTSDCGYGAYKAFKNALVALTAPAAPTGVTITAVAPSVCGAKVYRYAAPATLPVASATAGAATGWLWSFTGTLGANAVIDSGDVNSRVIRVTFTSNVAAGTGDSVRVAYLSSCGNSVAKAAKLTNVVTTIPAAPTSITITALQTNVCGARKYRYAAPGVLPVATATAAAATGWLWSFTNTTLGNNAVIDSGDAGSKVITVTFSSNAAAGASDSVRLQYTSSCGLSATGRAKLTNAALVTPTPATAPTIQIVSDICGDRRYRYTAPALVGPTATAPGATGWLWSFTGTLGGNAVIDSGSSTSQRIVVRFTVFTASAAGDSVRVAFTSGCGTSASKSTRLSNVARTCTTPANLPVTKAPVVNTPTESMSVKVFPNPSTTNFNVQVITAGNEEVIVRVLDLQGRFIKSVKVASGKTLNIGSELKAGAYFIEVRQGKEVKTTRVIKF